MAAAVVIALVASGWAWWRQRGDGADSPGWQTWLSVNLRFYGSLALAMAYLNNWFVSRRGIEGVPPSLDWGLVDILFAVVTLSTGLWLWGEPRQE